MKKILKRGIALLIALLMMLSATSCSKDTSWTVKLGENTVPVGAYIYFMSQVYSDAYYLVEDYTQPILEQEIDGQKASDYIKERALGACKNLLAVEKKFDDLGLSLTSEELKAAQTSTESSWSNYQIMYEAIGVSKESFHRTTSLYSSKARKVFNAIFGPEGSDPVPNSDVEEFFLKNYESFQYFSKALTVTDKTTGVSTDLPEKEILEIKDQFEGYVKLVKDGRTAEDASAAFKADEKLEYDPLQGVVTIATEEAGSLPKEIISALKSIKVGEAAAVNTSGYYYFVYKLDINKNVDSLKTESTREAVLSYMKGEDYSKLMDDFSEALEFTVNDASISEYGPSIIEKL